MKVLHRKRHAAQLARRIIDGTQQQFGGTTQLQAELDDSTVDGLKMRAALERCGHQLAAQYDKTGVGSVIVGVELHSINFSFITAKEAK